MASSEIRAGDRVITIGDVATVLDTTKEPEGATLIDDREVVSVLLYKEVGANTIAATAGAGSGSSPCSQRTVPWPIGSSEHTTSSAPRRSSARQLPRMSMIASTAPTS